MSIEVPMPRLSDTMEEGTLVKWHVKVGDRVEAGQHVADVETDKATMELQVYEDGTVARLAVAEGEAAAVGKVILVLAGEGEDVDAAGAPGEAGEARKPGEGERAEPGEADERTEPGEGASAAGRDGKRAAGKPPRARAEEPEDKEQPEEEVEEAAADAQGRPARQVKRQAAEARGGELPEGEDGEAGEAGEADEEAQGARERAPRREADGQGGEAQRLRVSPLAAKMAADRGIDLAEVQGTGPEGRIIKRDILAFAEAPARRPAERPAAERPAAEARPAARPAAPAASAPQRLEERTVPVSGMRKTIARRLVESKTTIPHFTVTVSVNMDPLLSLRQTLNAQLESTAGGLKLSVNDFVVRAAAIALGQHPMVNASWTEQGIRQHGTINLGIAVALPAEKGGGLVVPVLRDAQDLGLRAISARSRALAEKAKGRGLSAEEMADGTFTVSNLGPWGVDHFEAIINPPQAAILAVGTAMPRPVVREGRLEVGHEMSCTLSADHRVIDGTLAAEFLTTLKGVLENPAVLLV